MKKIGIALLVALAVIAFTACTGGKTLAEIFLESLDGYIDGFGHVRVLGDIDHILKGEPVDDEEGVTVQSMTAGEIAFNDEKTELTIPLTLKAYDFDGHRNPGDSEPEKYTRTATGVVTIVFKGTMNDEGSVFTATAYEFRDMYLELAAGKELGLASLSLASDSITGLFVDKSGSAACPVEITVTDGRAVGIADVNAPKFERPDDGFLRDIDTGR